MDRTDRQLLENRPLNSALQQKQCFLFHFNETPCGTAVALVAVAGDGNRRRLLLYVVSVWTPY